LKPYPETILYKINLMNEAFFAFMRFFYGGKLAYKPGKIMI